jgi:hypothetical protein
MSEDTARLLTAAELRRLAEAHGGKPCAACAPIRAPGWESIPGSLDRDQLRQVGTLRRPEGEEPTLEEFHPAGTNAWSADAPMALGYFPYNRCDVWECVQCARPFLRYTEYGGYYVEERIRELDAALVMEAPH